MANPWTKKNPLLSMALSGANAWASAARGFWAAEAKRNGNAAARQVVRTLSGTVGTSRKRRGPKA